MLLVIFRAPPQFKKLRWRLPINQLFDAPANQPSPSPPLQLQPNPIHQPPLTSSSSRSDNGVNAWESAAGSAARMLCTLTCSLSSHKEALFFIFALLKKSKKTPKRQMANYPLPTNTTRYGQIHQSIICMREEPLPRLMNEATRPQDRRSPMSSARAPRQTSYRCDRVLRRTPGRR